MKLKRFVAPNTRSAMQQIKATFGPDAVILSSSRVENGVEIVAAVDFDETVLTASAAIASADPAPQLPAQPTSPSPLDDMRLELQTLRGMLEVQMRGQGGQGKQPLHAVLIQKLLDAGVSQITASHLAQQINPSLNQQQAWQQVLSHFSDSLTVRNLNRIEEGGIYAFVGPTGVGKTTTLAKIAARFSLRFGADKLGLITMDNYRIAAQEQLMLYGKILGVQVCVADDDISLTRVIKQLNDKKLILIDTAGMNPVDERVRLQMDCLNNKLRSISTVLVLQATSDYHVLMHAISQYGAQRLEQCIITKLDEALTLGGTLSAMAETGLEVSYLTHGQRVPEDIKIATRHQLMEQFCEQEKLLGSKESRPDPGFARRLYVES
ncbi:flagellar biosynthesis protein FlhF [Legionella jordanis]|uniref:Flagellar biosynthesis protein FlhF n=1 Tax=Legionella jordanis TaxID=456 RepID=A0A0W0V8T8_9GAMM|nr:flagellar biosynthesis protein FlhF [Legionella jordanis]KTD16500.1 flagellar GTP-binding protein FlhF [Legionella jordanis]RMX03953.1 flagellar biosynthesis protein FlhF [Legionella jordanis]RMX21978.1 flagellar biosynthesis protein FlhF [Legionella jordanis]VEH12039.1 flagellar GTP-binding protein FlhF [Legionella jordanis]HAT8712659.1 flagellar biosynthesis protein FlhF [Legionella jordanis]